MKVKKVIALKEVAKDLEEGRLFYERKEPGIGDYFFDSKFILTYTFSIKIRQYLFLGKKCKKN